jgi:Uma2 family endonuclease
MSPAVDISATLSPAELYERLATVDGLNVELLNGRVVMTGSATVRHNMAVWFLIRVLFHLVTSNGWALLESQTIHVRRTGDRPRPDITVASPNAPRYDSGELYAHGVEMVAEVTSPGTANADRGEKVDVYATGGVPLYLVIDIAADPETVTLYSSPRDGRYESSTTVRLGEKLPVPEPFSITLDTAAFQVP